MITQVDVQTLQGTLLSLLLEDTSSGIIVQDIDGLDPVKATLVSSSFAAMDGAQYQSSRRDTRNITMTLGLDPDYVVDTVRDLRKRLYNFFMPKSQIGLRFYMDDGSIVDIAGRVESFESPLFSNEPKVDISIICFDSDFIDSTSVTLSGSTVSSTAETHLDYEGTIETGFVFVLHVNRSLTEFTIYNRPPDNNTRVLDVAAAMVSGDTLTISTINGSKSVLLTRSGITTSLLYAMSSQSSWVDFQPGDNYFRIYATGAAIPYTITFTPRYGGL